MADFNVANHSELAFQFRTFQDVGLLASVSQGQVRGDLSRQLSCELLFDRDSCAPLWLCMEKILEDF